MPFCIREVWLVEETQLKEWLDPFTEIRSTDHGRTPMPSQ
jgi:hypothetical protein